MYTMYTIKDSADVDRELWYQTYCTIIAIHEVEIIESNIHISTYSYTVSQKL